MALTAAAEGATAAVSLGRGTEDNRRARGKRGVFRRVLRVVVAPALSSLKFRYLDLTSSGQERPRHAFGHANAYTAIRREEWSPILCRPASLAVPTVSCRGDFCAG